MNSRSSNNRQNPAVTKKQYSTSITPVEKSKLNKIISSLYHHYQSKDNPPADQLIIPEQQIRQDPDEPSKYTAMLKYIVHWCGKKEHVVHVGFTTNSEGKVDQNSLHYV